MRKSALLLIVLAVAVAGCGPQNRDPRIHAREGIGSDTPGNNIITRPFAHAFSALTGQGIEITKAASRRNAAGFLEIYVNGYNKSYKTKRFKYKVEWLDADGLLVGTKTSTWLPYSVMGKSPFTIKVTAPRTNIVDFRMDTRK